jgi:hypothetical protein
MTQEEAIAYTQIAFDAFACGLPRAIAYRPLRALSFLFGKDRLRKASAAHVIALRVLAAFVAIGAFEMLYADVRRIL